MPNPRVFFNFEADGHPLGRVVFELFRDEVPKTVENFRALATGEKGLSQVSQTPLYYKGCIIHRSIENFMIQGGDFTKRNGTGGESIYGHPFEDENFNRDVDAEGLLVMANRGPNTNSSQFFITVRPCPHLNGKHVVFGRVVSGQDIVKQISEMPVDEKSRPLKPVVIASCGELELRKAPPKPRDPTPESRSASPADSDSDHERQRRKSRRSRSASPEGTRSKHKKHKSKRKDKDRKRDKDPKDKELDDKEPRKETEEEYDARLEREENERIIARRKAELEERKRALERERERTYETAGVRYKGRGQMKYRGPDSR
ncbi:peptidyl-prolyl isomerase G (cyclophilin G) [Rhizoctonia solani]|uniref:peptidylprolyl isomerase n=1 Tax=Rhizoctonia solani TaxID=456999 RepID=A0A0K6GCC2_9AGAM|nr:peptidyl-prolyl isomerase G (cyclophilin G) [Rhizoctonia solani]